MGNCCSDVAGAQSAVGGTGINQGNPANAPNEAVDAFLKSRGYQGLYSQIELSLSATSLRDRDVLSKVASKILLAGHAHNEYTGFWVCRPGL